MVWKYLRRLFKPRHIWSAAERGDVQAIRSFVAKGADVNGKRSYLGWTPLHYAANSGHLEAIRVLVHLGANVNARGTGGDTPLTRIVAEDTKTEVVDCLLGLGADINKNEKGGATALSYAAFYGDEQTVRYLLSRGANPNGMRGKNYVISPLVEAARGKNIRVVEALLQAGAEIETEAGKDSALQIAALYGELDIVHLLLAKGADPNHRDDSNDVPLMSGVLSRRVEIVKALLEAGADVNAHSNDGSTPLTLAEREKLTDIINLLKQAGAKRGGGLPKLEREEPSSTSWELEHGMVLGVSIEPWPSKVGNAALRVEICEDDYHKSFSGTLEYRIASSEKDSGLWARVFGDVDEDGKFLASIEVSLTKGDNVIQFRIKDKDGDFAELEGWSIKVN